MERVTRGEPLSIVVFYFEINRQNEKKKTRKYDFTKNKYRCLIEIEFIHTLKFITQICH